ncbi:uncharacterized protein LOC144099490 isoform X2 [Amblyomma americanum]
MEQRSMMLSRAMSQRSVVIRPATQETGGMMQYLLTIIFLICTFWVVVGALYFFYNKKPPKTSTEDDIDDSRPPTSCPGTIDQGKPALLSKTIVCSVPHNSAFNLWVYLPEGICGAFVALGLTRADGTVQQGAALSVERLSSIDRTKALVSVDYSVVTANSAKFGNSLKSFLETNTQTRFKRLFDGIEVRGIPVADYQDNSKMAALSTAIAAVRGAAPKVQRVIATLAVPPGVSTPAQSTALTGVDTVFVHIHNPPASGNCAAQPPNSVARITQTLSAMSSWNKVCLSILLGAMLFRGAGSVNAAATECAVHDFCKADAAAGGREKISDADSFWKRVGSDLVIYDSPEGIESKVRKLRDKGCIYVDHIELDDHNCTCQKSTQFPLLSSVRKGMS